MNKVAAVSLDERFNVYSDEIRRDAVRILKILNKNDVEAEIYLIDGRKMKFLNKKFRGKDKTTTILSFKEPRNFIYPPSAGGPKRKKIGEIYIKLPIANCQLPITNLLIHGFLHLFGYNHYKKRDRIKMEKAEQEVLRKIRSAKREIRNPEASASWRSYGAGKFKNLNSNILNSGFEFWI